ncbi:calcium/proton exchanger [Colletotrichum lupini]|uniref:Calcium/proton exchanger n=1 Tax=Colletotrichum lupini TaxID=145971 RepID=A0A9Q8WNC2_9PEZI|nr:calcium/proton exchanger [Colletotrichum lupini]UQC88955.1 calcium/proton exchanger [Colletotrichum lupini]
MYLATPRSERARPEAISICCRAFTEVQKDTFAAFERMDTTPSISYNQHLILCSSLFVFTKLDRASGNSLLQMAGDHKISSSPLPAQDALHMRAKMDPAGFISATSSTLCDLAKVMYWLNVAVVLLANILGFAGQDFAWKMSQVAGLLNETTFGFLVEIIPFIVPILKHETSVPRESSDENNLIPIIQAPILGSILTNLLLCLLRQWTTFSCCLRTLDPKYLRLCPQVRDNFQPPWDLVRQSRLLSLLHLYFTSGPLAITVIYRELLLAKAICGWWYGWTSYRGAFTSRSSARITGIFDEVIEIDEQRDADRKGDMEKPKFTLTGSIIVLFISWYYVPDQSSGLKLLPLYMIDNYIDMRSSRYTLPLPGSFHPCGSPQRATVVLVERALENPMDLDCRTLMIALLVLSILVCAVAERFRFVNATISIAALQELQQLLRKGQVAWIKVC